MEKIIIGFLSLFILMVALMSIITKSMYESLTWFQHIWNVGLKILIFSVFMALMVLTVFKFLIN